MRALFALFIVLILAPGCSNDPAPEDPQHPKDARSNFLPNTSGQQGEIMVVMPKNQWDGAVGETFMDWAGQPYRLLPQHESLFKVNYQPEDYFYKFYKEHRNIILLDVGDRLQNQEAKVTIQRDVYARDQVIFKVFAKNETELRALLEERGPEMARRIGQAEVARIAAKVKLRPNRPESDALCQETGLCMTIPSTFQEVMDTTDFKWYRLIRQRTNPELDQSLFVYSYPYVDDSTFTRNRLLAVRDSVLKRYVKGGPPGSYMATEFFYEPGFTEIDLNGQYAAEIKGLWQMEHGFVGGPFVSLTFLDEVAGRVITVEGNVLAPHEKKREHIRYLEGVLHTAFLGARD